MNIEQMRRLINKYRIIKTALYPAIYMKGLFFQRRRLQKNEIIDNFCELLCEDPVLKVKEFNGVFAMDARSDLFRRILFHETYEPQLVELCLKYIDKNKDVIDIGANIGFYTIMFAKILTENRVLSIEPTKNALKRLHRNVKLNNVIKNVDIFEGVASNHKGAIEIKTIAGKEEYSSMGKMKHPSISKERFFVEKVASITIDELIEQKSIDPGFIKADVEGVEHLVFEGAQKTLQNNRPIILSELSNFLLNENGSSSHEVINLIKKHEYDVIDPLDASSQPGTKDFSDIMCFPKEMGVKLKY